MKRFLAIFLVALMVLGVFASCKSSNPKETEAPTDEVVEDQAGENTEDDDFEAEGDVGDDENDGENDENNENDNNYNDDNTNDDNVGDNDNGNNNNNNNNNNDNNGGDDGNDGNDEEECSHFGGEDATCKTESVCDLCGEPYGGLDYGNHEGKLVWEKNASTHTQKYSCCGKVTVEATEHDMVDGVCFDCEYVCTHENNDGHNCSACMMFLGHNYVGGACSVCKLSVNGSKVTFVSYPQSKVTSSSMVSTLNSKASGWTESNGMWYADVENGSNKYRGVRTSANGTATWFVYEPITWTIVSKDTANNQVLILCDMVIDAQKYGNNTSGAHDNSYENSTIRAWLNNEFIKTAFSDLQKDVVLTTTVSNSDKAIADYNSPTGNPYLSADTEDKIFLLSKSEIKNGVVKNGVTYAYLTDADFSTDASRQKKATAYAIAQIGSGYDATNGAWWWLRTPYYDYTAPAKDYSAHTIKVNGTIHMSTVDVATGGVVPAMWIQL